MKKTGLHACLVLLVLVFALTAGATRSFAQRTTYFLIATPTTVSVGGTVGAVGLCYIWNNYYQDSYACYTPGLTGTLRDSGVNVGQCTWSTVGSGNHAHSEASCPSWVENGALGTHTLTLSTNSAYTTPLTVDVTGFVNPKYVIVGVTYAPPGPSSNVTYTNSTLVGTTTTTTSSFLNDVNVTVTVTKDISAFKVGPNGFVIKLTNSQSTDSIQGSNSSSTVTVSKAATVSYKTNGTDNACAPVNHDDDTIWLWLNPLMVYTAFAGKNLQWNGYGYDPNDPSGTGGRDVFPVQVKYLNGHAHDPSIDTILARGWVTTYEPGMIWPAGEGPGLTSTDKANILAADPFTNPSYILPTPPPSTTADGRFTQDPYPPNPIAYVPGGLTTGFSTINENTQSVAQGTSYTYIQAFGTEANFSGGSFLGSFTIDLKTTHTLTSTNTWLNTLTVTQTNTNALSVTEPSTCNPPYAGPGQFIVFQDNQNGTFMFYPEN